MIKGHGLTIFPITEINIPALPGISGSRHKRGNAHVFYMNSSKYRLTLQQPELGKAFS